MKYKLLSCLLLTLISLSTHAENPDIYGYFQSDFLMNKLTDTYFQTQTNKLQITLKRELSYDLRLGTDINFLLYTGQTIISIPEYLPDEIAEQIPEEYKDMLVYTYEDKYEINNLYGKYSTGKFDITAGKQQTYFGSGYSVNPVDFYRRKDIVDPSYEQPGINSFRVDFYPGLSTDISLLLFPESDLEHSGIMGVLRQTVGHFDFKIAGVRTYYNYTTLEVSYLSRLYLRNMAGISINGEAGGAGIWIESAQNWVEDFENFNETVIGIDYTLESGLYMMAEHFYKSNGRSKEEEYTLTDWIQYFSGEKKSIIEHQTYLNLNYPLTDLIEITGSTAFSFIDHSLLFMPEIKYNFSSSAYLILRGMFNLGSENSLFSENMGHSGLLRLKIYF